MFKIVQLFHNKYFLQIPSLEIKYYWSSHCGTVEINPTSIHEDLGLILGLGPWVRDPAWPWAVVQVADVVLIPRGCDCGIGRQL